MISKEAFADGYARLLSAFPFTENPARILVWRELLVPVMNDETWTDAVYEAITTMLEAPTVAELLALADAVRKPGEPHPTVLAKARRQDRRLNVGNWRAVRDLCQSEEGIRERLSIAQALDRLGVLPDAPPVCELPAGDR